MFDRNTRKVLAFSSDGRANGVKKVNETEAELGDPALDELLTPTCTSSWRMRSSCWTVPPKSST